MLYRGPSDPFSDLGMTGVDQGTGTDTPGHRTRTDRGGKETGFKNKEMKIKHPDTKRELILHKTQDASAGTTEHGATTAVHGSAQKMDKAEMQQTGNVDAVQTLPCSHCQGGNAMQVPLQRSCHPAQNTPGTNTIKTNYVVTTMYNRSS